MRAPARLAAFAVALVVIFAVAAVVSGAVVPASVAESWQRSVRQSADDHEDDHSMDKGGQSMDDAAMAPQGVSIERDGYRLADVSAPDEVGRAGDLSFRILDKNGQPLRAYRREHTKELHLIVVRADGANFQHVHPQRDATGTWSLPWQPAAAGTYRIYADFTPAARTESITLTQTIQVGGNYLPKPPSPTRTTTVDGFDVTVSGDLRAGDASDLTVAISRDGRPVTTLQPYLGAFGHLVVLRDGDLAYLHVHPEGDTPTPQQRSGPDVDFMTDVPTPGRYLLYFDFRVDDTVHTAGFVLDADQR